MGSFRSFIEAFAGQRIQAVYRADPSSPSHFPSPQRVVDTYGDDDIRRFIRRCVRQRSRAPTLSGKSLGQCRCPRGDLNTHEVALPSPQPAFEPDSRGLDRRERTVGVPEDPEPTDEALRPLLR